MKENIDEYKQINREIKDMCIKAKQEWIEQQCLEIEKYKSEGRDMHKKINEVIGKKSYQQNRMPKIKNRRNLNGQERNNRKMDRIHK